jgi:hypothetical protein
MNYSLQFIHTHYSNLVVTPRKRAIKHCLLRVNSGLVLIRLKQAEYALQKGDAFWVPFDCLTAYTLFPGSEVAGVEFSTRLNDPFPSQAGYVELPAVSTAILDKLSSNECSEAHQHSMLQVIRQEVCELKCELRLSKLSEHFSNWSPTKPSGLDADIQLALKIREARKLLLSGTKRSKVVERLFSGCEEEFDRLSELLLGQKI